MTTLRDQHDGSSALEIRRRRARFRAEHRGTKEMDWLLGRFAQAMLPQMDDEALEEFEQLLSEQVTSLHQAIVKDPFSNRKETVAQVKENLKKELHSWRIIGKLFGDRLTRAAIL